MAPGKTLPSENPSLSGKWQGACFMGPDAFQFVSFREMWDQSRRKDMPQSLFISPPPSVGTLAGPTGPGMTRTRDFNSGWSWFCLMAAIAVVYALTGHVCASLSAVVANVSWMLYIPAALSIMASLMWGSRVWPAIFAGELAMGLFTGQSFATSSIMAAGNALDAALTGWWFHDRLGRRIELDRIQDVVQLLAGLLLILQPLCTAIGMAALVLTGNMPPHKLGETASAWYSANIYAEFIAGPTAIGWLMWPRPATKRSEYIELAALALATLVVGAVGPGRWAFRPIPLPVTLILVFPLLAWASIRFVPSVAVTVSTALGLFAFDAALAGLGPYSVQERMVSLNVFMSVSIGTGLFIAAAAANERRFESEQEKLIAKLRATATQVSRLEEFVTFCAWSGRVRWKDEWVSVETFLSERYNLNISHGISDDSMRRILTDAGLKLPPRLSRADPDQDAD
jgi:integral membrane sensor domain MASE1